MLTDKAEDRMAFIMKDKLNHCKAAFRELTEIVEYSSMASIYEEIYNKLENIINDIDE